MCCLLTCFLYSLSCPLMQLNSCQAHIFPVLMTPVSFSHAFPDAIWPHLWLFTTLLLKLLTALNLSYSLLQFYIKHTLLAFTVKLQIISYLLTVFGADVLIFRTFRACPKPPKQFQYLFSHDFLKPAVAKRKSCKQIVMCSFSWAFK